jgi:hypothetical protein
MVSNDSRYVQSGLSKLVDLIRLTPQAVLVDFQIDVV